MSSNCTVVADPTAADALHKPLHAQHITRQHSVHQPVDESPFDGSEEEAPLTEAEALLEDGPERALLLLGRQNLLRRAAAAVVTNRAFEWAILFIILANCITLAMYSHQPGFDETQLGVALSYTDYVFAACFSLELLLKVVAMGLVCAPGTYLRDGWNILDGAVVVLGWLDIALSGDEYTLLRTVRVLRPLRTITHIKGLKVPVATLAKALPMLLDVLLLCLFAFFVFGIVAVQLFAGALRNRCAAANFTYASVLPGQQAYSNVSYLQPADGSIQQCSGYLAADVTWTPQQDASGTTTPMWSGGSPGGGWSCPTQPQQPGAPLGTFCAAFDNPNNGMTSFDNIVWAWATIFQCLTTEGWTDIMYALQDAVSPWVLVYFLMVIIFGSFFLVNLALAVLYLQFTKEFSLSPAANSRAASRAASAAATRCNSYAAGKHGQRSQDANQLREHLQRVRQEGFGRTPTGGSQSGSDASEDQCLKQQQECQGYDAHAQQLFQQLVNKPGEQNLGGSVQQPAAAGVRQAPQCGEGSQSEQPGSCLVGLPGSPELHAAVPPKRLPPLIGSPRATKDRVTGEASFACSAGSLPGSMSGSGELHRTTQEASAEQDYVTARVTVSRRSTKTTHWASLETAAGPHPPSEPAVHRSPRAIMKPAQQPQQQLQPVSPPDGSGSSSGSTWQHTRSCLQGCWAPFAGAWALLRRKSRELVKSGWVEIASLVVIISNTAVMASHSYPENPDWVVVSDYLNVAFCCYFTLELLVKLLASGPKAFIRDRMNQFDALVVAASIVEMVMFLMPGDDATSSSLSVLRTARLLRVFKLARSWSELNRIITTILKSFSQVLYLSLLLMLFVFVFALMGMQLFGYRFASCSVDGAQALCVPGTPSHDCPPYPDCYVPCAARDVFSWINVTGSPYNGMAYCEQFPRSNSGSLWGNATAAAQAAAAAPPGTFQYWAQVGKAAVPDSRFDNIGWAVVSVFQTISTENWNNIAYNAMSATSPAAFLWFVAIIVLGNYILLNLFLAILLENFGSGGANGGASTANSTGGTLAAAAKAAQLMAWVQDLLDVSWFARMFQSRNRVAALQDMDGVDELAGPAVQGGGQPVITDKPGAGVGAGHGGTRGPAILLESSTAAGAGLPVPTTKPATGATGGQAQAAARRRSFMPLVAPSHSSDNLQGLAGSRQGSFLGARTQSTTGGLLVVSGQSFSCASMARSSSNPDLLATATAAAAAQGVHRSLGSVSGHRLSSMAGHRDAAAAAVQQQQNLLPMQEPDWLADAQQPAGHQLPGAVQQPTTPPAQQGGPGLPVRAAELFLDHGASPADAQQVPGITPRQALTGHSCCLLSPTNPLRLLLHKLLSHRHFENAILLLIFTSSITLALDMPSLDPLGHFKQALEALDCVFAVLFLVEAVLKILVHGLLFNGPGSYLRNPWNCLDGVIVVVGVVVMGTTLSGLHQQPSLSSLKALRTLRALRPLRVASRLEGMKVVVNSLFASLPALGNVLLVCLLFYLIFGIMAVDLLGGAMYGCQDASGQLFDADYVLPAGQTITRDWCLNRSLEVTTSAYHSSINVTMPPYTPQREWSKPLANYDNIALATFTLWQISTTELWVDTMYKAIAAVGVDQQPRPGHNPVLALFFIAFIIFGGYFVLQLFVSVTIEKFSEMHQQQGKSALLTPQQEGWLKIERMMADINLQVKHQPPRRAWRAAVFYFVMSQHFDVAAMAAIIANCVVMALTHADMSAAWQDFMTWANLGFTVFFTAEILLKFVALGFKPVLRDAWCRFDILVVAVSIVGVGIDLGTPENLQILPLLRVLRVVRIFRLVPKAEGLRLLLRTLVMSLPALGNIVSVLGLFFFIYAVIGMNLWGAVKHGQYLTRLANFQHVGIALLTLFRMITGESWDGIMQDCMLTSMCVEVVQDVLVPADSGVGTNSSIAAGSWLDPGDPRLGRIQVPGAVVNRCSPSPIVAVVYFCSFVLLCGLVLMNFVIAVLIDNFASSCQSDDLPISKASVDHFAQAWSDLDPQATHYIPATQLSTLIQELLPPMGVRGEAGARAKIQAIIMNIDIPLRNGKIHFLETMHALAGRVAGTEVPDDEEERIRQRLYPRLPSTDAADVPKYGVSHFYAALYVQAAVRGFLKRHALQQGRASAAGAPPAGQQRKRRSTLEWLQQIGSRAASSDGAASPKQQSKPG